MATLFIRNPGAAGISVLLNGEPVRSWVLASDTGGWVVSQEFPEGWEAGMPLPIEREQFGKVTFQKKEAGCSEDLQRSQR